MWQPSLEQRLRALSLERSCLRAYLATAIYELCNLEQHSALNLNFLICKKGTFMMPDMYLLKLKCDNTGGS